MKRIFGLVVTVLFAAIVWVAWQCFMVSNYGTGSSEEVIVFDVPKGTTFNKIAQKLETAGLVKSKLYFSIYARATGNTTKLRSGEYELNKAMTMAEVLAVLSSGKSIHYPVTIPEGINLYEIAAQYEKAGFGSAKGFIELAHDKVLIRSLLNQELPSLEGYLFPETYNLTRATTQREIVELMVKRFLVVYSEVLQDAQVKIERHKAVTLASIIEKETGASEERPRISSVFHNRLVKGMRLQSDPTILYGVLVATNEMKKNITRRDLESYTPYNTYRVSGLPAGPIANPGREALWAVHNPDNSKFLYFVSRNDGTHVFSDTLKDHNDAVRKFQLDRRQREGKSWRDLNKNK